MADVIDTGQSPETFALELSRIVQLGPCVRLQFTVPEGRDKLVVANVIVPQTAIAQIVRQLTKIGELAPIEDWEIPRRLSS